MPERQALLVRLQEAADRPIAEADPLLERLTETHPADLAFALEELEPDLTFQWFTKLPAEKAAEVIVEFEDETQEELLALLPVTSLASILDHLAPDDAVDVYQHLPERLRIAILAGIDSKLAGQIRRLEVYDEETAGGLMTPHFIAVPEHETLEEVLERYKAIEDLETDQLYVVDGKKALQGVVGVQDLLHQDDRSQAIKELMDSNVLSVKVEDDQEEVVRIATTYGLTTVPVVSDAGRILGIVTADDIDQVAEDEASEDMYRMAGSLARNPTKEPVLRRIMTRIPMLALTVVIGLVISELTRLLAGTDTIEGHALRFLPIIIGLAGNVANVANAVVVRGLATGEIEWGRLRQPFGGEFLVGVGVGLIAAALTWGGSWLLRDPGIAMETSMMLSTAVSLALFAGVVVSAIAGFWIPLIVNRMGVDPALTGPVVTAVNDLSGTAVYVAFCLFLLHL